MQTKLKNYTSGWTITRSVNEIQNLLASKGAEKVMIDYLNQEPVSISFAIKTSRGVIPFTFPANVEKVQEIFFQQKKPKRSWMNPEPLTVQEKEQAKRTAWKNIYDLLYAQLAIIETDQVKLEQLLLGFAVMNGKSIMEHFESGNLLPSGA